MVFASRPVCSVMRLAARPVGAASSTPAPAASSMRRSASSVLVLPTPGPPVITATLALSSVAAAARCEGESGRPVSASTVASAAPASISSQGRGASSRAISRSAIADSAACRPRRNRWGTSAIVSITTDSPPISSTRAVRSRLASTASNAAARATRSGTGRAQWPSSIAAWSA